MSILPNKRPTIKKESAEKIAKYFLGDNWENYPVVEIAVRQKKINFYDDELAVITKDDFKIFNWNAEPSAYIMKGQPKAILKKGVHFYKLSYHHIWDAAKRYVALRPNTPDESLPVWRTKGGGKFYSDRGIAINQHKGGANSTWSEGCQTTHFSQYDEFIDLIGSALGVKIPKGIRSKADPKFTKGIGNIPYILIDQADFDYIIKLNENEFDSVEDLRYQAAQFVNVPKLEKNIPHESEISDRRAEILTELEQEEIISAAVPAILPATNDQLIEPDNSVKIPAVDTPKLNQTEQPPIQNADAIVNVGGESVAVNQPDEPFYQYLPRITKEKILFYFGTAAAAAANIWAWLGNLPLAAQIVLGIILIAIVGGFIWLLITHRRALSALILDAMQLKADKRKNTPILTTEAVTDEEQVPFRTGKQNYVQR